MIPLPVIANVYRVTFNWHESTTGMHAANVLHFQRSAGTAIDVFNTLNANVTANMWYCTPSTAKISSVDIIKLDGSSGTVNFATSTAGWIGQGSAADFVVAGAYIVKFVTGVRGRANRGRIYLPWPTESQIAAGNTNATAVTAMQSAWTTFLSAMTTATNFLVIASYDRKHGGAGAHSTIVNVVTPELVMGTQRRRQQRLR